MSSLVSAKTVFAFTCLLGILTGGDAFAHGGHGGGHGGFGGGHFGGYGGGFGGYGGHHGFYGGYGGYGLGYGGYGLGYGGYGLGYGGYGLGYGLGYGMGYGLGYGYPYYGAGYGYGYGYGYPGFGYGYGYGYPYYGYGGGYPWYSMYAPAAYYSYRQPTYTYPLYPSTVYSGSSLVPSSTTIVITTAKPVLNSPPPSPMTFDNGNIVLFSPAQNRSEAKYSLNGMAYTMKPGTLQKFKNDRNWVIEITNADGTTTKFILSSGNFKFRETPSGIALYKSNDSPESPAVPPAPMPGLTATPTPELSTTLDPMPPSATAPESETVLPRSTKPSEAAPEKAVQPPPVPNP